MRDAVPDGVLLVDKPAGPTSHDVVRRARKALGTRRVGHTGTLDPFASGLLILCVGRATRLADLFHLPPKRYEAVLRLGVETDSFDADGEPGPEDPSWETLAREDVAAAAASQRGRILQVPPAFSAKKVQGERAHRLARRGVATELAPVPVTVFAIEVTAWEPPLAGLSVEASSGTYVRALARDIGRALGCGAHLDSLRRTAIGPLHVEAALPAHLLERETVPSTGPARLSPLEALDWLPRRSLDEAEALAVSHGARIPLGRVEPPVSGPLAAVPGLELPVALRRGDRLVAVARPRDGDLQPVTVLDAA